MLRMQGDAQQHGAGERRAVVREEYSPSSWSGGHRRRQSRRLEKEVMSLLPHGEKSGARLTLSLDLVTLGEGEVGGKEIGTVLVGHGEEVEMYWRARGER